MSALKPIKIYGKNGPNPPKVRWLAEELGLPYEIEDIELSNTKNPEYLKVNPNGRIPAIHDPNTNLTLWESGAILEYLVEQYDKDHKFSFERGSHEYYHAKQWLFFQVSGQGPYYGQAVWFTKFHPEQIQSARERYYNEIKRVIGVVEGHLKKQNKGTDGPWLVGDKFSYVDLAWLSWQQGLKTYLADVLNVDEFTVVNDWVKRIENRPAIQRDLAKL